MTGADRPRAREIGVVVGTLPTGPLNSITDVGGVRVGHVTRRQGTDLHTGVTVVMPHDGNLYDDKVPAGLAVGNGYGKLMGATQIAELGEIETPIALTNTLSVPEVAAGVIDWTLAYAGNESVVSVNAVVGETNDSYLNDIRRRVVRAEHVHAAINAASAGVVDEGGVGAGAGTMAFGWKGGIGSSSRVASAGGSDYTVGILAQVNYGGDLHILGVPVGRRLSASGSSDSLSADAGDGSVMIVIATDAPLSDRNLARLGRRAFLALGRTGSAMTNGSGDYAVAFSTSVSARRTPARRAGVSTSEELPNELVSPLFQATVEATEEAVYNALFKATTTHGYRGIAEALPLDRVGPMLERS
jgi:D-aminopeptidase